MISVLPECPLVVVEGIYKYWHKWPLLSVFGNATIGGYKQACRKGYRSGEAMSICKEVVITNHVFCMYAIFWPPPRLQITV